MGNETILVKRKHHRYYDVVSIPQGYVWLAGDNASNSTDSRTYGPVSEGLVLGKATLKLSSKWPFVRVLDNNIPAENAGARVKMPRGGKRAAPEPKEDSNEQKSLVPQVVEKYADSPVAVNKQLENIPIKREMDGQMVLDLDGLSPYEKVLQRRALVQHQQKIEEEIAQDSNKK